VENASKVAGPVPNVAREVNAASTMTCKITAQTKALLDRTYLLAKTGRKLENKVGAAITVGGRAGHEFSAAYLMDFMTLHGMVLPGKAFAQSFSRELGAVAKEEKAMKEARALGERVVKLTNKLA
jgi:multimeric flavodoxin WrbA